MALSSSRFNELMGKYLQEQATKEELQELSWWLQSRLYESELEHMIQDTWLAAKGDAASPINTDQRQEIVQRILDENREETITRKPVVRLARYWWVAAACLLITAGIFLLNPFASNKDQQIPVAANNIKSPDIVPGSSKAVLTLDDGSVISLNDQQKGRIANQGNTSVFKQDSGLLSYEGSADKLTFNTLHTPRGGEYRVVLNDGTRVWLNAATSLRFPVSFTGSDRVVELDGEAYFEVASNKSKPFRVKMSDGTTIEVTGTHFNIMAYSDEASLHTTLLEGAITVKKNDQSRQVRPGEQAIITANTIKIAAMNEPLEAIAWKNGLLSFRDASLQTIMRQVARWYDVDVNYQGEIPQRIFSGSVNRSSSLKELLKIFELSDIRFTIQGRKIQVSG